MRMTIIRKAVARKAMTIAEIAEYHLSYRQTRRYVSHLHHAGLLHIVDWPLRGDARQTPTAAYRGGAGIDAMHKPMTNAERQAAHIARVRADMDAYDRYRARDRARKSKPVVDPLLAALFGRTSAPGARP
jgi:hypothetical protein